MSKPRNYFIPYKINRADKHGIVWAWNTTVIDFEDLDNKLHTINANQMINCTMSYIFGKVGTPDAHQHTWRNGDYSFEYNTCLNALIDLELIHIQCDVDYEENERLLND